MKTLTIKSIELNNFKNIKHIKYEFEQMTNIAAKCGSGKSTIYEAYKWCFGANVRNYEPIIDEMATDGIDVQVVVNFTLDGFNFSLTRHATRKNGKLVTTVSLDGYAFPSQKQYEAKLEQITGITPSLFYLLVETEGFIKLSAEKQRDILMLVSNIDEANQINNTPEWINTCIENGENAGTIQKMLTQRKSEISHQIDIQNAIIDNNNSISSSINGFTASMWNKYADTVFTLEAIKQKIAVCNYLETACCPKCGELLKNSDNSEKIKELQEQQANLENEIAEIDKQIELTSVLPILTNKNNECKAKIKSFAKEEQQRLRNETELEEYVNIVNSRIVEKIKDVLDKDVTIRFAQKNKSNTIKNNCAIYYKSIIPYDNASHGQKIAINYYIALFLRKMLDFYTPIWIDDYGSTINLDFDSQCQVITLTTDNTIDLSGEKFI